MTNSYPLHCRIDDLVFDESTGCVMRGDKKIELPKLSYSLFLVLLRESPTIVSQTDIMKGVWENKVIAEKTLQQRVKLLRRWLGDCPDDPRYIATIRGQGYRLIAEVDRLAPTKRAVDIELNKGKYFNSKRFRLLMTIAASFLILLTASFIWDSTMAYTKSENAQWSDRPANLSTSSIADNYYKNAQEFIKLGNKQDNESAILLLKQAIELDVEFAAAHALLGRAFLIKTIEYEQGQEWINKAIIQAEKSITLQPTLVDGHQLRAYIHGVKDEKFCELS